MSDKSFQKKIKSIITKVKEKTHQVFNEDEEQATTKDEEPVVKPKRIIAKRHSSYIKETYTLKQQGKIINT